MTVKEYREQNPRCCYCIHYEETDFIAYFYLPNCKAKHALPWGAKKCPLYTVEDNSEKDSITEAFKRLSETVAKFSTISSPSKLMEDEVGHSISKGSDGNGA